MAPHGALNHRAEWHTGSLTGERIGQPKQERIDYWAQRSVMAVRSYG